MCWFKKGQDEQTEDKVGLLGTKEGRQGMAQEFSHPTRGQMPEIACPDPFGMETFHQLTKGGLYAVTDMSQKARARLFLMGCEFEGGQEQ